VRTEGKDLAAQQTRSPGFDRTEYLTPDELALSLGIGLRTLSRWHALRIGPPRISIGHLVLYRISAVEAWLRDNEVSSEQATGERP